jgi:hypothetical protein
MVASVPVKPGQAHADDDPSLATTMAGWWWLDPLVGLGIAGPAASQGSRAWRGEDCR